MLPAVPAAATGFPGLHLDILYDLVAPLLVDEDADEPLVAMLVKYELVLPAVPAAATALPGLHLDML